MKKINKGNKYNRLTIIKEINNNKRYRIFLCKCECGNIKEIQLYNITKGITKSCGCLQKENIYKIHGMTGSRIYNIWSSMKRRCNDSKADNYYLYGGRGIKYVIEWEKFEGFYKDMKEGYSDNLTLDRKDNDKCYFKSNCRWITMKEQQRNRRNNRIYKGKCIAEWCEELKLDYGKVMNRINKLKWSIEKSLEIEKP